jgi:hypothetical protein
VEVGKKARTEVGHTHALSNLEQNIAVQSVIMPDCSHLYYSWFLEAKYPMHGDGD